jgi:phospholipid transport system substrate-binding protein
MSTAMRKRSRLLGLLAALVLFFGAELAQASGSAEDYVRAEQVELGTLLLQPKTASRDQKISSVMDRVFDFDSLAKRSLGDDWGPLNEAQRSEFKTLLEQLVKQSYRRNLDKTKGWEVNYEKSTSVEGGVRIPTVAKHKTDKRKDPVSVDYLLHETQGQWRVYDVVIEGSSLVSNYQSQFRKIIRKKGFDELVSRMKNRVAKGTD